MFNLRKLHLYHTCILKLTTNAIASALQPKGPSPWWLRVMAGEPRFRIKQETGTTPTSLQA